MAEAFRNRTLSVPVENEQTEPAMERKNSMAFKDISALTLAEQLTYLEYKMLRRIPVSNSRHLPFLIQGHDSPFLR